MSHLEPLSPADLSVVVSDLLVATPGHGDPMLDPAVAEMLGTLRTMLKVDAVFVSEVVQDTRVTRQVCPAPALPLKAGDTVPLAETWCQLVLEGRAPEWIPDVGALAQRLERPAQDLYRGHVSIPVRLASGRTYGTLCALNRQPLPAEDARLLDLLTRTAALLAERLVAAGHA